MPKQLNLIDSPLKDIDLGFSLEEELEFNLELARFKFDQDRSTALAAFQALNYLVGYCWRQEKQPLDDTIPLPCSGTWEREGCDPAYRRHSARRSHIPVSDVRERQALIFIEDFIHSRIPIHINMYVRTSR